MRRELESLAQRLGLGDSVKFLGERIDAQAVMAGAKVFVLASRWEGFGRVIIEALNARVPVVATEVEGIPEIISDGVTGLLTPAEDHQRLAERIVQILSDSPLADRLAAAGLNMVRRRFTVSAMLACEFSFYSRVLHQRHA